ncbi:S8 family serine peptidase [Roseivirga sp.]|uniref:S8 family serine peptidase n=1 Tax=Roseivirga sp. TaxID=1964215 RepID=UPI003B51E4E2
MAVAQTRGNTIQNGLLFKNTCIQLWQVSPEQREDFLAEHSAEIIDWLSPTLAVLQDHSPNKSRIPFTSHLLLQDSAFIHESQPGTHWIIKRWDKKLKHFVYEEIEADAAEVAGLLQEGIVNIAQPFSQTAKTEANTLSHDLSVNGVSWIHAYRQNLKGEGRTLAIKEQLFDTLDIDLYARYLPSELIDPIINSHATSMASIAAGAGNTSELSLGAASGVTLTSSTFTSILPDAGSFFDQTGVKVQNHSYGLEITNIYDLLAEAYDEQVNDQPQILHVFSSGNSGFITPESGRYAQLGPFSNLTGGFKMAKNILTVGAIDQELNLDVRSSKGPTSDGRIKPEIVAYGEGGTSEAAALVSGTSILLREAYFNQFGEEVSSAALKAILIAGADSIGQSVVSYSTGFGNLNAKKSLELIEREQIIHGQIDNTGQFTREITLPVNSGKVRIALVWNDPAATAGDLKSLKNNLNLKVAHDGQEWLPWTLDPSPRTNLLDQTPQRGIDTLNNIELVTLPLNGDRLTIQVSGESMLTSSQAFHIAYSVQSDHQFEWLYPSFNDPQEAETSTRLRFLNSYQTTGILEMQLGDGSWQEMGFVEGENQFEISWPSFSGKLRLRARFGTDIYTSDDLLISPRIEVSKIYLCEDEFLLSWNSLNLEGAFYELSKPGNSGYLEPFLVTSDTFAILNRSNEEFLFDKISIRGRLGDLKTLQAQVYDFTTDGIGCFYTTFTSSVDEEIVKLNLDLSGLYNIASVSFEKLNAEQFESILSLDNPTSNLLESTDSNTRSGYYSYRAKINLLDAINGETTVLTDTLELPVILKDNITVFPNPIQNGEDLNILNDNLNAAYMQIINHQGAVLQQVEIKLEADSFEVNGLSSGMYLYRIFNIEKELIKSGRLIVY